MVCYDMYWQMRIHALVRDSSAIVWDSNAVVWGFNAMLLHGVCCKRYA